MGGIGGGIKVEGGIGGVIRGGVSDGIGGGIRGGVGGGVRGRIGGKNLFHKGFSVNSDTLLIISLHFCFIYRISESRR